MWSESFVTGRGPGAFAVLYPKYRAPGANETQYAHNWIVQRGVEGGAIAVVLSLVGIAGAFAASRRELRARTNSVPLIAFAAGAIALITHGLVDYTLETREATQDLGLALGVLAGSGAAATVCTARARIISITAILAAGCALWPYAARPAFALDNLQFARDLAQFGEPPEEVERRLQRAVSWTPDDPRLWSELGQLSLQSNPKVAVECITKALSLNPSSAATHEGLALALAAMGRNKDAAHEIDISVALHPLDPSHWLTKAQLALEDGDDARARDAIKHAGDLPRNPVEESRLRALQARMGELPR
jgi:tetratricopeptide (TPR) repeat protein